MRNAFAKLIPGLALSLAWLAAWPCAGQTLSIQSAAGIEARLNESSGRYDILWQATGWTFSGALEAAAKGEIHAGTDALGPFREIRFTWKAFTGNLRLYDARAVAWLDLSNREPVASFPAFPRFDSFPPGLHAFSFRERPFAPPVFRLEANGTPWMLFNNQADTVLISPADDFMLARMSGDGVHEIASGLNAGVQDLPAHFSHGTLLAFAPGIHAAWETWGGAFQALQGRTPPANDADPGLRYLGYWTDNGAYYYYNYETNLGYAGTLQKLARYYRGKQIPIRYLQLDSWWYEKTLTGPDGKTGSPKNAKLPLGEWNRYGGLLKYQADPAVLPNGLAGLHDRTALPLITHNRWVDPASPYHRQYKISGLGAVDPQWWDDIMLYIAAGGVICYEQDWCNEIYAHSPEFQTVPGVGAAFTDGMARGAAAQGLSLQYCMATPRFFLQGARYPNLTTIRVSNDRFCRERWEAFLYVSQLASAAGIWPWTDVFMSTETNNLLLANLSAGMVGVGDAMGRENRDNLMRVARPDGVLVKPDAALLPLDQVYVAQASGEKCPMVAWTYSDHGGLRTAYVFAYNRTAQTSTAGFLPSALGLQGNVCVLDTRSGRADFRSAAVPVAVPLAPQGTAYDEVAAVGRSGLAFFGDPDKFISNGRQRIASLTETADGLTATVTFAAGEKSANVFGYAKAAPEVLARSGAAGALTFDEKTGRFQVTVSPAAAMDRSGSDPVQTSVIEFRAK